MMRIPAKMLRAVWLAAAKKDIRQYLNGVHVDVTPTHTVLVATDGWRIHLGKLDHGEAVPRSITIPHHAITAALTGAPDAVVLDMQAQTLTGNITARFEPPPGRFPEWRRVIPAAVAGGGVPPINREYLADAAKACQFLTGPRGGMVLHGTGMDSVIVKLTGHPDFMALIMAQRQTSKDALVAERWELAHDREPQRWAR